MPLHHVPHARGGRRETTSYSAPKLGRRSSRPQLHRVDGDCRILCRQKARPQRIEKDLVVSAAAAIAQLGERQTEDLKFPGSIPALGIFPEHHRVACVESGFWIFNPALSIQIRARPLPIFCACPSRPDAGRSLGEAFSHLDIQRVIPLR